MLEASNLGQIIGRLEYGALEPRRPVDMPPAIPRGAVHRHEGSMAWRIVELLKKHPLGLTVGELISGANCPPRSIYAVLTQMPELERPSRGVYRLRSE